MTARELWKHLSKGKGQKLLKTLGLKERSKS